MSQYFLKLFCNITVHCKRETFFGENFKNSYFSELVQASNEASSFKMVKWVANVTIQALHPKRRLDLQLQYRCIIIYFYQHLTIKNQT